MAGQEWGWLPDRHSTALQAWRPYTMPYSMGASATPAQLSTALANPPQPVLQALGPPTFMVMGVPRDRSGSVSCGSANSMRQMLPGPLRSGHSDRPSGREIMGLRGSGAAGECWGRQGGSGTSIRLRHAAMAECTGWAGWGDCLVHWQLERPSHHESEL